MKSFPAPHVDRLEWRVFPTFAPYLETLQAMEARVKAIAAHEAQEAVWLLEHPPLYTAGTGACDKDILEPSRFPIFHTGRGGKHTYHGPGQRVAYVMMDLTRRDRDVRAHVRRLEEWAILSLASLGLQAFRREGRVGLWVFDRDGTEKKVAALGVRVSRWVTSHGLALNVEPNLSHFGGIVPCGLAAYGVTSLRAQGINASMAEVDRALHDTFPLAFF